MLPRVAVRAHAAGGPTTSTSPAAANDRMIGQEGSNSQRRTLNLGERG